MSPTDWIDSHFHVFRRPSRVASGARYLPSYGSDFASWRDAAPGTPPRRGVLVQTSFLGSDNRELLAELQAHPQALRGVAVVDPAIAAEELGALHRAGVRGVRLNLVGATHRDLGAARLPAPLADTLVERGWHVELHTDPGALPGVLEAIDPRLAVVLDHFGRPASAHAEDPTFRAVAARLASGSAAVYVKLSGAYRLEGLDARALAGTWRDLLGSHRLLWGSDWPCTNHENRADYPALLGALDGWLDDPAERRRVLLDNPLRLYWA